MGRFGQPINLKDRNEAINKSRQNEYWYQSSIDKATDLPSKFDIDSN